MLLFDFSDQSLKVLQFSSRLLLGKAITGFARGELKEGLIVESGIGDPKNLVPAVKALLEKGVPKPLADSQAALVLHDERVYTIRLNLPKLEDDKSLEEVVTSQVQPLLPVPVSSLRYSISLPGFVAVDQSFLTSYLELFETLGLRLDLAVPESLAYFSLVSSRIPEGKAALFLDLGAETTDVVLMDGLGAINTFTEPVETEKLTQGVLDLLPFAQEKFLREVKMIFLGGGGALSFDSQALAKETRCEVVGIQEILKSYPIPKTVDFGKDPPAAFLSLFGLALLSEQKTPLNLVGRT